MQRDTSGNQFLLSATDLANHLSCRHKSALDLEVARGERTWPEYRDPHAVVLQQRGMEHERAYVESLRARGLRVVELGEGDGGVEGTLRAMREGADAIVQAVLGEGRWRGRADVLLRVKAATDFGGWGYEAVDCKLSRETKGETVLQLCLYTELIGVLQGATPERFHVIRPGAGLEPETYRTAAFGAYYRSVKAALERFAEEPEGTYPEPVNHCDVCAWWQTCDRRRRGDDHLSLVAGATRMQRGELVANGVGTLAALAQEPLPLRITPRRGSAESLAKAREQARIQWEGRNEGRLKYELLAGEAGRGLACLPEPVAGDLFLDLEGDAFVGEGGLEYLFGVVEVLADGMARYDYRWAVDRAGEKAAYEWIVDLATEQARRVPGMHIYHYDSYEPSALKRLMQRYASREVELDALLRAERFVDLHSVVRQGVRASVERYGLKDMEAFAGYERRVPLVEASRAKHVLEHELEFGRSVEAVGPIAAVVLGYNEDDCRATLQLRDWLERVRAEAIAQGREMARPEGKTGEANEKVAERQARVEALFHRLTEGVPVEAAERDEEQGARWLLAHALDWHGREQKVKWWEFYQMEELSEDDWTEHKSALTGLKVVERLPLESRKNAVRTDRYSFPEQECSLKGKEKVYLPDLTEIGHITEVNWNERIVTIKKKGVFNDLHPQAVFAYTLIPPDVPAAAALRLGEYVAERGMQGGENRAALDLLMRRAPRLLGGETLGWKPGEDVVARACRLGLVLDESVLAIQGPPGSGKTYTGARMICELVRQGRKVGVTAVSHAALRGLLDKVVELAQGLGLPGLRCAHKRDADEDQGDGILTVGDNKEALQALREGVDVLGGTAWLWAREDFADAVDTLFVDEAGQMSLANVLACAGAARNLVLLGDPQQLEQPQSGSHPEGSGVSALEHLLNGRATIADEQGIFLAETRRLHPRVCEFTSELFYEGRLRPMEGLEQQRVDGSGVADGAGVWFVPVEHEGRQSYSPEEVDVVAALAGRLTGGARATVWEGGRLVERAITAADILIVAPYNYQVNRLKAALPGYRVGTVDKFQGQEAAVVIYSMTTSSAEDAPRGMEFLYDPYRFNVASSRAKAVCVVVGSPRLLAPECRTPRQMEFANVLCRYWEMSGRVEMRTSRLGSARAIDE